jgi:hypothetical protein
MDIFYFVMALLCTIAPFFYYSKVIKNYSLIKKDGEDNFFFEKDYGNIDMSFGAMLLTTFIGVFHICFIVWLILTIPMLLKDIILPETILLEYIQNFL